MEKCTAKARGLKAAAVAFSLGATMYPAIAAAHAKLVSSVPVQNGALDPAAKHITLTFSEPVKAISCKAANQAGKQVRIIGALHAEGATLHAMFTRAIPPGQYTVTCRVVGPDGHPMNTAVKFVAGKPKVR